MAENDIYLVRQKDDGTFEELQDSPFSYSGLTGDAGDSGNELTIKSKLRVPELTVEGATTIVHDNVTTSEQLLITNDGTGPAVVINQEGTEGVLDVQDDGASALYVRGDAPYGGFVGLGTTTPTKQLELTGDILLANNKAIYLNDVTAGTPVAKKSFYQDSSEILTLSNAGGDGVSIKTGATSEFLAVRIDKDGLVGMGSEVSDPQAHLDIVRDGQSNIKLRHKSNSAIGEIDIDVSQTVNDVPGIMRIGTTTNHALALGVNNVNFLTLSQTGGLTLEKKEINGVMSTANLTIEGELSMPGASTFKVAGEELLWTDEFSVSGVGTAESFKFLEFSYGTHNWGEGSPFIVEIWSEYYSATGYQKYLVCHTHLDTDTAGTDGNPDLSGGRDYQLKILESTANPQSANSAKFRLRMGTPEDTGLNDGDGYDIAKVAVHAELKHYAKTRIKVTSLASNSSTHIGANNDWTSEGNEYKFYTAPIGVDITNDWDNYDFDPASKDAVYAETFYGSRMVNDIGTDVDPTRYFLKPADSDISMVVKGNVGIGVDDPFQPLEIKTSGGRYGLLIRDADSNQLGGLFAATGNANGNGLDLYLNESDGTAYGSTKVRIASTPNLDHYFNNGGNVGIGTASPQYPLHVTGDAHIDGGILTMYSVLGGGAQSGWIGFGSTTENNNQWRDIQIGNLYEGIQFCTFPDGSTADQQVSMRITKAGKVGIGTASPDRNLTVAGNFRLEKTEVDGGHPALDFNSGGGADHPELNIYDKDGNAGAFILKGGNVGIGTDQPGYSLDVHTPNGSGISLKGSTDAKDGWRLKPLGNDFQIVQSLISGGERLTIKDGGDIEMGGNLTVGGDLTINGTTTTINTATLDVEDLNITVAKGSASAAAANGAGLTVDGAGATLLYNSTPDAWSFNKKVGIGTGSPSGDLELLSTNTDTNLIMGGTPAAGLASREAWRIQAEGDKLHIGQNKSAYAKYMTFKGNNVGIGTIVPFAPLHVRGPGDDFDPTELDGYNGSLGGTLSGDTIIHTLVLDSETTPAAGVGPSISFRGRSGDGLGSSAFATIIGAKENAETGNSPNSATSTSAKGYLGFYTASTYKFSPDLGTEMVEAMRISSGGNVGIGTSVPDVKLHLAGNASSIIRLENTDLAIPANRLIGGLEFEKRDSSGTGGAGVVGGLRMYSEGVHGEDTYMSLSTASSLSLDNEAMRIDSAGNVGIGVIGPTCRIDAHVDVPNPGITSTNYGYNFASDLSDSNNAYGYSIGAHFKSDLNGVVGSAVAPKYAKGLHAQQAVKNGKILYGDSYGVFGLSYAREGGTIDGNSISVFGQGAIDDTGDGGHVTGDLVGVYGSVYPTQGTVDGNRYAGYFAGNTHVDGDLSFTGTLYQNGTPFSGGGGQWTANGSDIYFNTGRVGIGTTTPPSTSRLSLQDTTNGWVGLGIRGSATGSNTHYEDNNWVMYASRGSADTDQHFFGFYNADTNDGATAGYKFVVTKQGNVGIGTTKPDSTLSVRGNDGSDGSGTTDLKETSSSGPDQQARTRVFECTTTLSSGLAGPVQTKMIKINCSVNTAGFGIKIEVNKTASNSSAIGTIFARGHTHSDTLERLKAGNADWENEDPNAIEYYSLAPDGLIEGGQTTDGNLEVPFLYKNNKATFDTYYFRVEITGVHAYLVDSIELTN